MINLRNWVQVYKLLVPSKIRIKVRKFLETSGYSNILSSTDRKYYISQKTKNITVAGMSLFAPESHPLDRIMEAEIFRESLLIGAANQLFDLPHQVYIDVGANIGDTAAIVYANAKFTPQSYLIEASQFFYGYLVRNQENFPKSVLLNNYVAWTYPLTHIDGELHHWGGTAKFVNVDQTNLDKEFPIDLAQLINKKTRLIKIDCDGLDHKILNSVLPRLNSCKPVFLFENEIRTKDQLEDAFVTLDHLCNQGYKWIIISRNCGTLIYSGVINNAVRDIFNFQRQMQAQGRRFDFPYSDILVFHESQENDFLCVSKDVRNTQELFLSKFTI